MRCASSPLVNLATRLLGRDGEMMLQAHSTFESIANETANQHQQQQLNSTPTYSRAFYAQALLDDLTAYTDKRCVCCSQCFFTSHRRRVLPAPPSNTSCPYYRLILEYSRPSHPSLKLTHMHPAANSERPASKPGICTCVLFISYIVPILNKRCNDTIPESVKYDAVSIACHGSHTQKYIRYVELVP